MKYGITKYIKNWKPYNMKDHYENDETFYEDLHFWTFKTPIFL